MLACYHIRGGTLKGVEKVVEGEGRQLYCLLYCAVLSTVDCSVQCFTVYWFPTTGVGDARQGLGLIILSVATYSYLIIVILL